jgi:hypothetical protein
MEEGCDKSKRKFVQCQVLYHLEDTKEGGLK